MLTIRPEQLTVFTDRETARFKERLRREIEEEFPEYSNTTGAGHVRALIDRAIDAWGKWGFETDGAIAGLVFLLVEYGEQLELAPDRAWALGILKHPQLPDFLKVSIVSERLAAKTQGRKIVRIGNANESPKTPAART